jgi:F-type H+-transporting ATPase subunit delta
MHGISRASRAVGRERLNALVSATTGGATEVSQVAAELFAVVELLDQNVSVRRALSDPARSATDKAQLVAQLLRGSVVPPTLEIITTMAGQRWSRSRDLTDATEAIAAAAAAAAAELDGTLDVLEDELFHCGLIIGAEPALRAALTDRSAPVDAKRQLLHSLLSSRVSPMSLLLITHIAVAPRGRTLERAWDEFVRLIADYRSGLIAEVSVATPLTDGQRHRLVEALSQVYGRRLRLNVAVDSGVIGGLRVRVGDDIIDGSVAERLRAAGQQLAA